MNANSAKEPIVRMRQICEGQVCECQQYDATAVRKKCDNCPNEKSAKRQHVLHCFYLPTKSPPPSSGIVETTFLP